MNPAKILLVDDHALFRHGVRAVIDRDESVPVVGEAEINSEALARARELHPDLVLMDLCLTDGNGHESIHALKRELPDVKVVVGAKFRMVVTYTAGPAGVSVGGCLRFKLPGLKLDELRESPASCSDPDVGLDPVRGEQRQGSGQLHLERGLTVQPPVGEVLQAGLVEHQ